MQITTSIKLHMSPGVTLSTKLALCLRYPEEFDNLLCAHVATMGPLGFNAHALGVMATRNLHLFLVAPQALEAHIAMLRDVFGPFADELADDIRRTDITPACLPAVAHTASNSSGADQSGQSISCLHKACLAGPDNVMRWSRWRLEQHLHNLVVAGLVADGAEARRACMQDSRFLHIHSLRWLLERKAAVLAAGGTMDDVRSVCCATYTMQRVLEGLLFWQRARYACLSQTGVCVKQCRLKCQDTPRLVYWLLDTTCLYVPYMLCSSADRLCPCTTRSPTSGRSTQRTRRMLCGVARGPRLASTWPLRMDRRSCAHLKSWSMCACKRR